MRLYFQFVKTFLDQYLVYRLSFVLWRFRVVLNLLMVYFLWASVFDSHQNLFGYDSIKMITYVLLTNIVGTFIFASRTTDVGGEILDGTIINYLLKPVSFLKIVLSKEAADKLMNVAFSFIEVVLLVFILRPHIFIQTDALTYLVFFIALTIGVVIAFFLSLAISFLAFWTTEIWGPRFIYFVVTYMLAGTYFPLDALPHRFYQFLLVTPFPYLFYLPAKLYLEGPKPGLVALLPIALMWAGGAYLLSRAMWRKGLREFSFHGR